MPAEGPSTFVLTEELHPTILYCTFRMTIRNHLTVTGMGLVTILVFFNPPEDYPDRWSPGKFWSRIFPCHHIPWILEQDQQESLGLGITINSWSSILGLDWMAGKPNLRNIWGSEQFDKRLDLSVTGPQLNDQQIMSVYLYDRYHHSFLNGSGL